MKRLRLSRRAGAEMHAADLAGLLHADLNVAIREVAGRTATIDALTDRELAALDLHLQCQLHERDLQAIRAFDALTPEQEHQKTLDLLGL